MLEDIKVVGDKSMAEKKEAMGPRGSKCREKGVEQKAAAAGSDEKIESKVAVQACMEGARTEKKLMEESKREGEVLMEQEVLHSGKIGGQEVVVVVQQPLFSKLAGTMPKRGRIASGLQTP